MEQVQPSDDGASTGGPVGAAGGSDDEVRARLIEGHLDLVPQVVLQVAAHFPRHVDRQELARAGTLGLVEAAWRFDGTRGVPFERFAARRIRGAVLDAVRAVDWAPRSVRAAGRRLEAAESEVANASGTVTEAAVADAMGITVEALAATRDRVHRAVVLALDHLAPPTAEAGEQLSLGDVLADRTEAEPDEQLESRELLGYLRDAVRLLPERHRAVIAGYFLEDRSSAELAEELDVTESRISQIRTEALAMLREAIEAQYEPAPVAVAGPGTAATTATAAGAPGPRRRRRERHRERYIAAVGAASDWRARLAV